MLYVILSIFTTSAYNMFGVTVTKHIGAVSRSINHISSSLLVWMTGLVVTLVAGDKDDYYKWESTEWSVILLQFFGFILLIFGNLVYN